MKKLRADKEITLKDFVAEKLKISKNKAKEIIDSRNVFVNNKRVWIATHTLKYGDIVEIVETQTNLPTKIDILYEDNYIIAVNKPANIISENEKNSIEDILRNQKNNKNIKAIHRLDKESSGILLFAKNFGIYERFKELWQKKDITKIYLAISHNEATFSNITIREPIDGKEAVSHVKLIKKGNGFSYFEVNIETGRKHQIRKHLASIRHPIVGDKIYGVKKVENNLIKNIKRQMLHAFKLLFTHPYTGKKISITAPIPHDFEYLLKKI